MAENNQNKNITLTKTKQKIKANDLAFNQIQLNPEFINLTNDLKTYLLKQKENLDKFDLTKPTLKDSINIVQKQLPELSNELDSHFTKIWELVKSLSNNEFNLYKSYYQERLVPLFNVTPYTQRIYEKPLGYPGDFIVMLYLYNNRYEGNTTYGKLIHKYSMYVPAAVANRNRVFFYEKHLLATLKRSKFAQITSIASGPAKEITNLIEHFPNEAEKITFNCIDFEKESMKFLHQQLNELMIKNQSTYKINLINDNLISLIKATSVDDKIINQDLIYSSGLVDYLSDKMVIRMMKAFYNRIKPGGKLIIGNVSSSDNHQAYTELLGDWHLNRRNENDMINLGSKIADKNKISIEYEKESKMNIFLIINK